MADANNDSEKPMSDQGDLTSGSTGTQNPQSTAHPNESGESNIAIISAGSSAHGEKTDSNEKNKMDESSHHKQTGGSDESNQSFGHHQPDKHEDMNTDSGRNEHDDTNKATAASNSGEDERMEDSASSHSQNKHAKKNKAKTSSTQYELDGPGKSDISYEPKERDLLESLSNNKTNQKLIDRLLGCAYGQALGDAYGLSTEFEDRERVQYNYPDPAKLIPFPGYILTGHNRRWTRGDWTDDTDQWILILDTLMEGDGDVKIFAKKLTNWIRNGFRELGDYGGMGLGANVSQVVHSHGYLEDPLRASEAVWERGNRQAAPNGAVMRCSASAFVHFNDLEKVKSTTIAMCKTTHFDPRCIASCLAVCLTITYLLTEDFDNNNIESLIKRVQDETIEILGETFSEDDRKLFLWHTEVRTLEELNLDESARIGYTYKCLASGFYGLRSKDTFEKTLNDLIRYGGDADTNGAVCGTMFGARYGYKALPHEWLRAMPFKKWFDKKIIKHLKQMGVIDAGTTKKNE